MPFRYHRLCSFCCYLWHCRFPGWIRYCFCLVSWPQMTAKSQPLWPLISFFLSFTVYHEAVLHSSSKALSSAGKGYLQLKWFCHHINLYSTQVIRNFLSFKRSKYHIRRLLSSVVEILCKTDVHSLSVYLSSRSRYPKDISTVDNHERGM